MTTKEYNQQAKEMAKSKINNLRKLRDAVPLVVNGLEAMKGLFKNYKETCKSLKELSDQCAEYAQTHDCLDGFKREANGVMSGDLIIDDQCYHIAFGYDGYKRIDGYDMDQEFLEALPETWRKICFVLDKTAIKNEKPTVEDLREQNLYQVPKNVWTLVEQIS